MRILHVIPSVGPARGGASKAALDMVNALISINVCCEIACTDDNGDERLNDIKLNQLTTYQGVPIRFFKKHESSISAINEFSYSKPFKLWLKNNIANYDLIHIHALFSFCSTYAMGLARKRGIKYIAHPIGQLETWSLTQSQFKKKLYLQLFELNNLNHASRVHFTAQSEADTACELLTEVKPLIVPLGLEIPELHPTTKDSIVKKWSLKSHVPIIVFLARIHPKKGLELLLNALARLPQPSFQLLIAGNADQAYLNQLKGLVDKLQLNKHCHVVGYIDGEDKNRLLQAADLFALTSYSENFGIAVLEALANGTPALVSNGVALSKEIAEHDIGYTCSMTTESVIAALEEALASPNSLQDKGARARKYAEENHRWTDLANQLYKSYQEIVTEKNS